jgi:hypothetical protein
MASMASMASVATMASMAVFPPPPRAVPQGYPAAAQPHCYSDGLPPPPPTTTATTLPAPMGFDLVAPTEQQQTDPAGAARGTIPHNNHHSYNNNNMHNDDQLQEAAAGRTRTTKTPADRLRLKQARAERNRASAERSRIKKRLTSHAVSEKVTLLESENTLLKDRVQQLATVLRSLQRIVNPE